MSKAKAFIFAAEEDFGIVPVEAQACGTPVIAFGKGGALETVLVNKTGLFFDSQTVDSLCDAVFRFESCDSLLSPEEIRAHTNKFSVEVFKQSFKAIVDEELKKRLG